jgi:hypothetical protein
MLCRPAAAKKTFFNLFFSKITSAIVSLLKQKQQKQHKTVRTSM